ncbi:hypothetical protein WH47_09304 [Habropoda laboriosa]|uniref:Histone-lysine N-methyltransferase SETMAR n=1 Tax=Habropoda laboriosa TaxID=597456 RepID=A0A0L7R941_9HYME|nr:hypothetical protein WH47_09304 [Habropoda laboriosa]
MYITERSWPPRSPDPSPLDRFLWGTLKNKVHREPPTTVADMQERIREACATLASGTIRDLVQVKLSLISR